MMAGLTLRRRVLCSAALMVLLPVLPAFASNGVPDWVRSAMALTPGSYSPETRAVVLLDEETLTVGSDGRAVERCRHVVKILRPSGREEGMVRVPFDQDEKLLSLHVWSVGPDGHEYQVKDSEMVEVGYPGSGRYYEDMRVKVANPAGRDPGGVVAYEYEQRMAPYLHEATWFFQDDLPHVQQSFTLELPASYAFAAVWAHHGAVKPVDLEHQRTRWELNAMPGIDLERVVLSPSMKGLMGRMTVHYGPTGTASAAGAGAVAGVGGSWGEVGAFYDQLARDRMVATPEIAAKAAELTAGKADFFARSEAIAEFVQKDIRYFVIEKGIGGRQPHPAADIFKNRYGDCKDKATLLAAMLGSVGIHSALVLVDADRGFVDPAAPSVLGNHAIGAIEIPAGYESAKLRSVVTTKAGRRYLIVDPTSEKTAFGQLEHELQGSYGVIVEGKQSELVELPVLNPELNTIRRTATFRLEADGSLQGAVVEKRFGDVSETTRYLYSEGDAKQRESYLNRRLSNDFTSFAATDVKVEQVAALNAEVTTSFHLAAERFGRGMGPLLMVRPRVFGSQGFVLDHRPRVYPIDLEQTMVAKDDFTIELPSGYVVDEMPAPVKVDAGFAAYESASVLEGTRLHYTRTYTVRELSLPAARYGELQKFEAVVDADEQNRAVFRKK